MTKKDYVLIAAALKEARTQIPQTERYEYTFERLGNSRAAWYVAKALAKENARFDRYRFLAACGVIS